MCKFKKSIWSILVVTLLLLLVACGSGDSEANTDSGSENTSSDSESSGDSSSSDELFLANVTTGSNTATSYAISAGISSIVQDDHPNIQLTVQTSGGGVENISRMAANEAQFGILYSPNVEEAKAGKGDYADDINDLQGILAWDYAAINLIVREDSGIKSVQDLEGKSIAVGSPGSTGSTYIWPEVLPAYGITEDNSSWEYLTQTAAATALGDGAIDAISALSKGKVSAIEEVGLSHDLRWLELGGQEREDAIQNGYGMYQSEQSADLYGDAQVNTETIPTIGVSSMLAVRADVSEDVVYNITKSIYENIERFYESHHAAKDITEESSVNPEYMKVELHPGAEKYYKEIGLIE